IAVGELGYNLINDLEEEVFLKQMDIAVQKDMLMTIHLPHNNKTEGMKRIEGILKANNDDDKRKVRANRYNREKYL
ncbi:MAG: hypothetical protein WAM14_11855, partial [Candidatus Nitrosopolaris sp.]